MRVMVTGGRDYGDAERVSHALDAIHKARPDLVMAFPGGAEIADAVRQARAAKIEVLDMMDVDA